jgi:hypothetical protein
MDFEVIRERTQATKGATLRHDTPVARTATEALRILWAEAFFRAWRKRAGIDEKLAQSRNHFSDAEFGMALKRATYLNLKRKSGYF